MFNVHNLNESFFSVFLMFHFSLSFKIYVSLLFYLNQTRTYTFIDVRIDVLMWFSVLNFTKDNYFTYDSIYNNICFQLYVHNRFCVRNLLFLFSLLQCGWPASDSHLMLVTHKLHHFGGFQTNQIEKMSTKVMSLENSRKKVELQMD